MIDIGKAIQGIRKERNMSQQRLAELVGVSSQAICNYEKNYLFRTLRNIFSLIFGIFAFAMCESGSKKVAQKLQQKKSGITAALSTDIKSPLLTGCRAQKEVQTALVWS